MDCKESMMEFLREIAVPRKVGSQGEKQVQDIISGHFERIVRENRGASVDSPDIPPEAENRQENDPPSKTKPGKKEKKELFWERQDFDYSVDTDRVVFGSFILVLMALLFTNFLLIIYFDSPQVRWGLPFTAMAIMVFLTWGIGWNKYVERIIRRKTDKMHSTANLLLRTDPGARRNLIFTAHYDSKSGPMGLLERTILGSMAYGASWLVAVYSLFISLYVTFAPQMSSQSELLVTRLNFIVQLVAFWVMLILALMFFLKNRNESPGALDNASGVAVLMELAQHFAKDPLQRVNLWFVATAAEEDGMVGMVNFMDHNREALPHKKSFFVNLDGVGGDGILEIVDEYGIPPAQTASALSDWLRDAGDREEVPYSFRWAPPAVGFDSVVPHYRGYQAVNISHTGFDKKLWATHTKGDQVDNINEESLAKTYRICRRLAQVVDGL